ncbi:hypothetical protein MVEG_00500 [Podila verticillata NRRL 6337]|nr:hypothetical protein MVEG_00500 [Podila verticillata NRRL 6337]
MPPPPPRIRRTTPLSHALSIVRWAVLLLAFTSLVLDIVSINDSIQHSHHFPRLLPEEAHLPSKAYIPLVLVADIMALALFTILLWARMRLPDRLHSVHTVCRILASVLLVGLALFCPVAEVYLAQEEHRWERYWCQLDWRRGNNNNNNAMTLEDASREGSGNSTSSIDNDSREAWQSERRQTCLVMRTRSIMAFVWAAFVFLELVLAVWLGEFKLNRRERRGLGEYGAQGTLDKTSNPSTSHVWAVEGRNEEGGEEGEEEVVEEELDELSSEEENEERSQVSITDSSFQSDTDGHDHHSGGSVKAQSNEEARQAQL